MSNAKLKSDPAPADLIRGLTLAQEAMEKRFAAIIRFVRRCEASGPAKDMMAQIRRDHQLCKLLFDYETESEIIGRAGMHSEERRDRGRYSGRSASDRSVGNGSDRQEGRPRAWRRQLARCQADCQLSSSGSPPNAASRHSPRGRSESRPAIPRAACVEYRGAAPARRSAVHSWSFRRRRHRRRLGWSGTDRSSHRTDASRRDRHSPAVPAIALVAREQRVFLPLDEAPTLAAEPRLTRRQERNHFIDDKIFYC
jgi:hypothetical protein